MKAATQSRRQGVAASLKGVALLAAAGVKLADAQYLLAVQRGGAQRDPVRLEDISRKVGAFLAPAFAPARAHSFA